MRETSVTSLSTDFVTSCDPSARDSLEDVAVSKLQGATIHPPPAPSAVKCPAQPQDDAAAVCTATSAWPLRACRTTLRMSSSSGMVCAASTPRMPVLILRRARRDCFHALQRPRENRRCPTLVSQLHYRIQRYILREPSRISRTMLTMAAEYLSTEHDITKCSRRLIEGDLFANHTDYVRRQIVYCILQVRLHARYT